jgi:hypothetical protein
MWQNAIGRFAVLPDIYKRILNAKYILERAAKAQLESNEMGFSISLLLMHDAVELLMLAVLDHLNIQPKANRDFMDFWPSVKNAGHPEPPDKIPMQSLNKLRVGLKHNGNLPHAQTVRDLLPRTKGFFENVLQAYCSLDYVAVSFMDLVSDPKVQALLREAADKFPTDKPTALANLKMAFVSIKRPDEKLLPELQAPAKPRLPHEMGRAGWDQYLNQLHSFLNASAARVNALMMGLDPVQYGNFLQKTPIIQWTMSGESHVMHTSTYSNVSGDDFAVMLNFVVEYAIAVSEISVP